MAANFVNISNGEGWMFRGGKFLDKLWHESIRFPIYTRARVFVWVMGAVVLVCQMYICLYRKHPGKAFSCNLAWSKIKNLSPSGPTMVGPRGDNRSKSLYEQHLLKMSKSAPAHSGEGSVIGTVNV